VTAAISRGFWGLDSVPRSWVYTASRTSNQVEALTISRLARLGGVNLETIRYYERQGLLPKPPRTAAGYRIFPSETARRLQFIKRAQELGFSLSEIGELLALRAKPGTKREDIRARAEAKIADIEQKMLTLEAMKKALRKMTNRCEGCGTLAECPILETLDEEISK
jgi:MerR family transcriptional regulator, copper efflux regulator